MLLNNNVNTQKICYDILYLSDISAHFTHFKPIYTTTLIKNKLSLD